MDCITFITKGLNHLPPSLERDLTVTLTLYTKSSFSRFCLGFSPVMVLLQVDQARLAHTLGALVFYPQPNRAMWD